MTKHALVGNHLKALTCALVFGMAGTGMGPSLAATEAASEANPNRLERDGIIVDFKARAEGLAGAAEGEIVEGDYTELSLSIRDSVNGEPIQGQYPGVWVDLIKAWNNDKAQGLECKQRIGVYLQGNVGIRPLIDLNSYFILVMNRDATISVIDPIIGISGITKLYTQILLKRPGGDWARSADNKRMYVSMPQVDEVAVVDTETFKVAGYLPAGNKPLRVVLQKDEKYLWAAGSGLKSEVTSVVAIDLVSGEKAVEIPIGGGHHEIIISDDDRYVFASNREEGTISVIDTRKLEKIKTIKTGNLPISLAWSSQSQSAYVADGQLGEVAVIDGRTLEITKRIKTEPGLGPMKVNRDGRWALVTNSANDRVYIIDTATNQIHSEVEVKGRPFRLAFSDHFAYVRALDSEKVSLINLNELDKPGSVPVVFVAMGAKAPSFAKDVAFTDTMQPAPGEAAMLVVSPGDDTVYYYMEGMNAPMGNFRNYGHRPRAVHVVDRTMKEAEPGVYKAKVKLPAPGTYDVAMVTETPRIIHCFQFEVKPNAALAQVVGPPQVEFLNEDRSAKVGEPYRVRFQLMRQEKGEAAEGVQDARVLYYRAPGTDRRELQAIEVEPGIYEVDLEVAHNGAYYIYVAAPSLDLRYGDRAFMSLIATPSGDGFPRAVKRDPKAAAKPDDRS